MKDSIFIFRSTSTEQTLYFFGSRHTNNPSDVQFKQLEKLWEEFLKHTKDKQVVFVEGMAQKIPSEYNEAIRLYGETGAIKWLAKEAEIDASRPEPNDEEQRKAICALFNPHISVYALIVRNLAGWYRRVSQTSFDEAVSHALKREASFSDIYGFTPDEQWLRDQHKELFGDQKMEDPNFLYSISDPRKNTSQVNKVILSLSELRNKYILQEIMRSWKEGKNIFIVYGRGHLDSLKDSLQKLDSIKE